MLKRTLRLKFYADLGREGMWDNAAPGKGVPRWFHQTGGTGGVVEVLATAQAIEDPRHEKLTRLAPTCYASEASS